VITKLIWLLDWMLANEKSRPSEAELGWRAACARWAKRIGFTLCAGYAIWLLGAYAASSAARPAETQGTVVWMGDASYEQGTPAYNGHASATRRIWLDGVRLQLEGFAEPILYTGAPGGGLRSLSVGDRVQAQYVRGRWLFWEEMRVVGVTKIETVPSPSRR
jgi:hypothetical protein